MSLLVHQVHDVHSGPSALPAGTQLAVDMARDAVQIFGGCGYMRQLSHDGSTYKVEELYRDSRITEIYEGANEIQKMLVAREVFGKVFAG